MVLNNQNKLSTSLREDVDSLYREAINWGKKEESGGGMVSGFWIDANYGRIHTCAHYFPGPGGPNLRDYTLNLKKSKDSCLSVYESNLSHGGIFIEGAGGCKSEEEFIKTFKETAEIAKQEIREDYYKKAQTFLKKLKKQAETHKKKLEDKAWNYFPEIELSRSKNPEALRVVLDKRKKYGIKNSSNNSEYSLNSKYGVIRISGSENYLDVAFRLNLIPKSYSDLENLLNSLFEKD
jgi:hypothetical protein